MSKLVALLALIVAVVSFSFGAFIPVKPLPLAGSTIGSVPTAPAAGSSTGSSDSGSTTGGGVGIPRF
ncbi:MAG: hypothetical protein CMJ48_14980 [Planctomycetaceae bacterium]|nr:hypothetical protein [Planctomycetaceae bacterium]